jgi:N-acetylglucosaminyl-diphospho-decaprenol L-rhamnosyltransferase
MDAHPTHSRTVALVVITHNNASFLPEFFRSWAATIAACDKLRTIPPEIIVVDTGSTDNTVALVHGLVPSAQILTFPDIGYGAGANRALAAAVAPWMLLCNPDLSFPIDFAQSLLAELQGHSSPPPWANAAIVAPRLLNADGTAQFSVGRFFSVGQLLRDQFRPRPVRKYLAIQPTTPSPIDWASGACLLIRRQAMASISGFDEKFFLYVEEVDLEYRLRSAGHSIWFVPTAAVIHINPNASRVPSRVTQLYAARGLLRYFAKHAGFIQLTLVRLFAVLGRRLALSEALASRQSILDRSTGPVNPENTSDFP